MRTSHRTQARHKREQMPKWWRPKLDADQVMDCKVLHWDLLDRMTKGGATGQDLLDWIATGFTYSELMRLLDESKVVEFTPEARAAIAEQLDSYPGVMERFRTTGRVGFNSAQLLAARAAAEVMDQLIEMDRFGFSVRAALWSEAAMKRIKGIST